MIRPILGLLLLTNLMFLGCSGGGGTTTEDSSSSSSSSGGSATQADGHDGHDHDAGDHATETSADSSGRAAETTGDASTTSAAAAPDDPLVAVLKRLGIPQLDSAYPSVHRAAQAEQAGMREVYMEIALLNQASMAALQMNDRDTAMEIVRHNYDLAVAADEKFAGEVPSDMGSDLSVVFYNGACALSLAGDLDEAFKAIDRAIELGFSQTELLTDDTDLDALRERPEFAERLPGWLESIKQAQLADSFPFEFELTDIDGESRSLAALRGKVVIVDIWGTWCPPCLAEIPHFVQLQSEYAEEGLQIVGLNFERGDDADAVPKIRAKIEELGINYPCALGNQGILAQIPGFEAFPTTLFIDREGRVRNVMVGSQDPATLEAQVKELLAEPAPADVDGAEETSDGAATEDAEGAGDTATEGAEGTGSEDAGDAGGEGAGESESEASEDGQEAGSSESGSGS